ncbi:hypothetical protein M378DRAFT_162787 [Amanita muscaria Koide BX008]|uniref:Uncharacterized protein n=1 Tax=Amanita muscaria (strain Koide BX008) TaxID=946122 RepID=A0A0C2WT74_AMAMK|nr:hypothetical protein M378DRAFT_162787 [Amanita muscaria Koide BX008]
MQRQWEKRLIANNPTHFMLQGAYERQGEEIQQRKGEERKQRKGEERKQRKGEERKQRKGEERKQSVDTCFVSSSPAASTSPLSSARASAGPQCQDPAWTSIPGFAWKTASSAPLLPLLRRPHCRLSS